MNEEIKSNLLPLDQQEWTRLSLDEVKSEGITQLLDDLTVDVFAHYNPATKEYDALVEVDMRGMCSGYSWGRQICGTFADVVNFYNRLNQSI
jgi:hypothetical protein